MGQIKNILIDIMNDYPDEKNPAKYFDEYSKKYVNEIKETKQLKTKHHGRKETIN